MDSNLQAALRALEPEDAPRIIDILERLTGQRWFGVDPEDCEEGSLLYYDKETFKSVKSATTIFEEHRATFRHTITNLQELARDSPPNS